MREYAFANNVEYVDECGKHPSAGLLPLPSCTFLAGHSGPHCDEDEGVWFVSTLEDEEDAE